MKEKEEKYTPQFGDIMENIETNKKKKNVAECDVCGKVADNLIDGVCFDCRDRGRYTRKRKKMTLKEKGLCVLVAAFGVLVLFAIATGASQEQDNPLYQGILGALTVAILYFVYALVTFICAIFTSRKNK